MDPEVVEATQALDLVAVEARVIRVDEEPVRTRAKGGQLAAAEDEAAREETPASQHGTPPAVLVVLVFLILLELERLNFIAAAAVVVTITQVLVPEPEGLAVVWVAAEAAARLSIGHP